LKTPVVIRKDYVIYLELFDNLLWFHTDVFKWSAEIKKRYRLDLAKLEDLVDMPLLAVVDVTNNKLTKFAQSFGWVVKGQMVLNNGNKALIYASQA
jgi:hypothetical protein